MLSPIPLLAWEVVQTVNCFIEALGELKDQIQGAVAASKASEELLRKQSIEVFSANDVSS